jgi:hypothetical protein
MVTTTNLLVTGTGFPKLHLSGSFVLMTATAEGVPRNGHVLVTNPNPVTTHASTGSVNPYPNTPVEYHEYGMRVDTVQYPVLYLDEHSSTK